MGYKRRMLKPDQWGWYRIKVGYDKRDLINFYTCVGFNVGYKSCEVNIPWGVALYYALMKFAYNGVGRLDMDKIRKPRNVEKARHDWVIQKMKELTSWAKSKQDEVRVDGKWLPPEKFVASKEKDLKYKPPEKITVAELKEQIRLIAEEKEREFPVKKKLPTVKQKTHEDLSRV